MNPVFNTHTVLAEGVRELFKKLENRLSLCQTLDVYLAGGIAVHLYTANRVTTDVDAEFGRRVLLPNDLTVDVTLEDGTPQVIYLDTNYNAIEQRANSALTAYVGNPSALRLNLQEAVALARRIEFEQ